MRIGTFFLFLLWVVLSCKTPNDGFPKNLVVTKKETGNTVILTCTAANTSYFEFIFEDGADPIIIINKTGTASHTYVKPGGYPIEVRAYSDSGNYISKELTIYIITEIIDIPVQKTEPHSNYEGMELVWSDEFDGSTLNDAYWTHDTGTGSNGWGNNELQYYRPQNTTVSGGILTIEARKESFSGSQYTSSRIVTQGKKTFKYGRIDIRAKLPTGQGLWPALWMLGSDFATLGWPRCGEIDIMEMVGDKPDRVFGTLHWLDALSNHASEGNIDNPYILSGATFADDWHIFSISWNEQHIIWYVDGKEHNRKSITSELSAFKGEFFFIFNVAVGGNLPGNPFTTTEFPQKMMVDYVEVYQNK